MPADINPSLAALRAAGWNVTLLHHAEAIIVHDMPTALEDFAQVLLKLRIPTEELVRSGGGEAKPTKRLREKFQDLEWITHVFETKKIVDGYTTASESHLVDHVKKFTGINEKPYKFGLEIEWNNKDPFFDRDLENFKRLHADGAISVGAIITRGASLQAALPDIIAKFARTNGVTSIPKLATYYEVTESQKKDIEKQMKSGRKEFAEVWSQTFCNSKFGAATTHWHKLEERISRGLGNPCPLILFGIPDSVVTP